jgi:molybdopterin molybdotransferase
VRPRGDDIRSGDLLVEEGDLLGPRQVAILAATGQSRVRARPRPRVVVLSTGSELRDPGTPLGFDSIYDSNSYLLAAQARAADAIAYRVGIVTDDPHELTSTLSDQLVRADLVVTSGGVSKGDYDVVKEVLSRLGTVQFDEVAMQPGKPQGFGTIGEDSTPIFTLPGNPVSSYISFEVFVLPAIRRMMGKLPYRRPLVRRLLTMVNPALSKSRRTRHRTPCPDRWSISFRAAVTETPLVDMMAMSNRSVSIACRNSGMNPSFSMNRTALNRFSGP